jgi:hypothetical protein
MPRYYFIVHDSAGEAPDEEGAELAGIEAAMLHAAHGARSMMCDSIKSAGEQELSAYIAIEDVDRVPIARLSFAEAVKIRG